MLMFFLVGALTEPGEQATEKKPGAPAAGNRPAPIVRVRPARVAAREGTIILSNKEQIHGQLSLTPGKRLRVWDTKRKRYRDIALAELSGIKVRVTRQRVEKEWRFKEEGNDEKVFTGRTYPRLEFGLTLTLGGKRRIEGRIARGTPLYLQPQKGKRRRFLIQPYMTGEAGRTAEQLVYLKEVVFGPPAKQEKKPSDQKPAAPSKTQEEQSATEKPAAALEEANTLAAGKVPSGEVESNPKDRGQTEERREECSSTGQSQANEKPAP